MFGKGFLRGMRERASHVGWLGQTVIRLSRKWPVRHSGFACNGCIFCPSTTSSQHRFPAATYMSTRPCPGAWVCSLCSGQAGEKCIAMTQSETRNVCQCGAVWSTARRPSTGRRLLPNPSRLRNKWQDMDGLGKARALGQEAPKCEESVAVLGHLIEN